MGIFKCSKFASLINFQRQLLIFSVSQLEQGFH